MANKKFEGLQNTPFGERDNPIDFNAEASTRYAMESENFVFVITVEVNKPFLWDTAQSDYQNGDF